MKLKLAPLALLLLFFQNLTAQKDEFFISLQSQVLKVENFDFRVEEVFDGRENKYLIGRVQLGFENVPTVARLENGVEKEFLALFQRSFPARKEAKPISIRVNQLEIYEFVNGGTEVAGVEINLSFLEKQEGGGYFELFNTGQFFEMVGLDLTRRHDKHIAKATEIVCQIFVERCGAGQFWNRPFDLKITPDSLFQCYEILRVAQPTAGFYFSFEDFRDNLPKPGRPFVLTERTKKSKHNWVGTARWADNQQKIESENFWGLCDGQDVFIKSGEHFVKLARTGQQFSLISKTRNLDGRAGMVMGVWFGGLVGGVIGMVADAAAGSGRETEPYFLNLQTGSFSPEKNRKKKTAEARAVIFCNKVKDTPSPAAQLTLGGKPVGKFEPNEAYKIHIPVPAGEMEVCIETEREKVCKTYDFKPYQTVYLEVYFLKVKYVIGRLKDDYLAWFKSDLENGKVQMTEMDW